VELYTRRDQATSNGSVPSCSYGHVVLDPNGDEWRDFWLGAYEQARRPKRAVEGRPGVAPVWPGEGTQLRTPCKASGAPLQES
jgi:hypothetical protein